MSKNEVSLRELQLTELEILKEFIRVCKQLNLTYFLDSGTLLGCIRHNGFIPWDDDIDVSMPREDYEIFLKEGQSLLEKKYFLQTHKTDVEYTMPFAKIRNSETTFIEKSVKNSNINHGVYIDIFPFDGYNPKKKITNFINLKKYNLYNIQIGKKYTLKPEDKSLKTKVMTILSNIFYLGSKTTDLLDKKIKIAKKYKYQDSKYICTYCYPIITPNEHYILRQCFGKGTTKIFEGIEVNVPEDYDTFLTRLYGDYMQLPPEEKRIGHHYSEGVDLNKPYKEYIKENMEN